ncbi:hypothetical protein [Trinickia sp.]|uniref:hypothetical protein n=1 Tax=Trinickia sp. TaxID=2571163 RepID=UPI003F81839E
MPTLHRTPSEFRMEPSLVNQLRANLVVTSLAASLVQVAVLLSIVLLRVPEGLFLSDTFRLAALAIVAGIVLVVHWFARVAFHTALDGGDVIVWGGKQGAVIVSSACPRPLLVALHLRFNRRRFAFQSQAAENA